MFLPLLGLAVGGALSGAGAIAGQSMANSANQEMNTKNNEFNAQQAGINRDYQTQMSNSAYQRARADMVAAGLNPMLMAGQGGSSTPGGAQASASSAAPMQDALGKGVSSAIDALRLKREFEQTDSQVSLNKATEVAQAASAKLNRSSAVKAEKEAKQAEALTRRTDKETQALASSLPARRAENENAAKRADFDRKFIQTDAILRRIPIIGKTIKIP